MLSHPEAVAKAIEAAATGSIIFAKSGEHLISVNVLYQTFTRATAGRDGHAGRRFFGLISSK
jgi:hypothetical protein